MNKAHERQFYDIDRKRNYIQSPIRISCFNLHKGSIQTSHIPYDDSHVERFLGLGFSLMVIPTYPSLCLAFELELELGTLESKLLSNW